MAQCHSHRYRPASPSPQRCLTGYSLLAALLGTGLSEAAPPSAPASSAAAHEHGGEWQDPVPTGDGGGASDAEGADTPGDDDTSGTVIVPLVLYTPETHLGLGGLLVRFFRFAGEQPDTRVSSLAFVALGTTRKQAILEMLPQLYWDSESFVLAGKLEYQSFPDSFWGIGNDTPEEDEERYHRQRVRFRGGLHRRVLGPFFAGLSTDLMWFHARYPDPTGIFTREAVPGEEGGVTAGLGPTLTYDTRDNPVASRRGSLFTATFLEYHRALGSQYAFRKLILEGRHFVPLLPLHTLALRIYGEAQGGDVPFYQLAMLGGDEMLRGYFLGRYRDKHMAVVEAEYRFPLYWRFGGVAFAGAGKVFERLTDLDRGPLHWAAGGGLRLSLNQKERLNLRLDVGVGPGTSGVYLSVAEVF